MKLARLATRKFGGPGLAALLDLPVRRRWLALLLCLALRPGAASAADPLSRLSQGPLIRIDQRTADLGQMPQHATRAHVFVIRNDGTESLRISKAIPDCGCTVAQAADTVIAPGASTDLRVVFSSGSFEGDQRKVVTLETNDPAEPRIDLLLLVRVNPEVEISDPILDFGPVRRGTTPVLATTLKAMPGVEWKVRPPAEASEYVRWTVAPDPQAGPSAWKVEATIRPDAPFGRFNVRVEIPYEHPKAKLGRISVRGFVHAYFSPVDPGINFGSLTVGKKQTRTLRLQADGPGDYRITAARASAPFLTTELRRDGNDYLLTVVFDPKDPMRLRETVTIETTDPEQPQLTIDVRGTVR
jgi:hypothetical protein